MHEKMCLLTFTLIVIYFIPLYSLHMLLKGLTHSGQKYVFLPFYSSVEVVHLFYANVASFVPFFISLTVTWITFAGIVCCLKNK